VRLQHVARTLPAAAAPRRATLTAQVMLTARAMPRLAQAVRVPMPRRLRVRWPLARPVTARRVLAQQVTAQVLTTLARRVLARQVSAQAAQVLTTLALARRVLAQVLTTLALAQLALRQPVRARRVPDRAAFAQVLTVLALLAWTGPVRAAALLASGRLRRVLAAYLAWPRQPARRGWPRPAGRRARCLRSCPLSSVRAARWLMPRARHQRPPGSQRTERMGARQPLALLPPRRQQPASADPPLAGRRHPGRRRRDASLPGAIDRPVLTLLRPACPGRSSRARPGPAALRAPAQRTGLPAASAVLAPAYRHRPVR
jgi:hypothetical protein